MASDATWTNVANHLGRKKITPLPLVTSFLVADEFKYLNIIPVNTIELLRNICYNLKLWNTKQLKI